MKHASFLDMIVLNYQTELVPHVAQCYLHTKGISPLKCPNCPYETLSPNTPFFSLRLPLTMGYCCQATAQACWSV